MGRLSSLSSILLILIALAGTPLIRSFIRDKTMMQYLLLPIMASLGSLWLVVGQVPPTPNFLTHHTTAIWLIVAQQHRSEHQSQLPKNSASSKAHRHNSDTDVDIAATAESNSKTNKDDEMTTQNRVSGLIQLLKDHDEYTRMDAAYLLGTIGPEAEIAIPALSEALDDQAEGVRMRAIQALGNIGVSAIPALVRGLEDKDDGIRISTVVSLSRFGPEAKVAVPTLIRQLSDENPIIRMRTIDALERIAPSEKTTVSAFVDALHDPHESVRFSAARALNNIAPQLEKVSNIGAVILLEQAQGILESSGDPYLKEYAKRLEPNINTLKQQHRLGVINWLESHLYISVIIGSYILLLIICMVLLAFRPLWLLRINETLINYTDIKLPDWLGGVVVPFRHLFLVGFFHYNNRVLDAWVISKLDQAQHTFSVKATVEARKIYVPVPVILDKRNLTSLTADNLHPTFSKKLSRLMIWGEGGAGKTSLACLLAAWSMSEKRGERICREHPMLPVLIEQDLEIQSERLDGLLLHTIGEQLRATIDDVAPPPALFLQNLLKSKRVLVIIDGLSEMNEVSRRSIIAEISHVPVNAVIVTSRVEDNLNNIPQSTIKPLRIRGNKLSTFMEMYLLLREKRDLFDDEEFFNACRRLSMIVGDREITALLAKYYAEQMIAAKEGTIDEDLPENIPDLMLNYINIIYRKAAFDAPPIWPIHHAAKVIAWECLKKKLRPTPANREDVLAALGGGDEATVLISYLEEVLRIIRTVDVGKERIRFSLDPLAEYLAGLHLLKKYADTPDFWHSLLLQIDNLLGNQKEAEGIKGFLLALRDCCLAKAGENNIPSFILNELTLRLGLSPLNELPLTHLIQTPGFRYTESINIQHVSQHISQEVSQLSNIDDVAKVAVSDLVELLKGYDHTMRWRITNAIGGMGAKAESAVPALVKLLWDTNKNVRIGAIIGLAQIGPGAKNAAPALIELLQHQDDDIRFYALSAMQSIGSETKAAIFSFIELLRDPDPEICIIAIKALGSLGIKAKASIPALIKLLESPDILVCWNAAVAIQQMGSLAKMAIPALIKLLQDQLPLLRMSAACGLAAIGREAIVSLNKAAQSEDAEVRNSAIWALSKITDNGQELSLTERT